MLLCILLKYKRNCKNFFNHKYDPVSISVYMIWTASTTHLKRFKKCFAVESVSNRFVNAKTDYAVTGKH
jgi:hypothetical protein